MTTIAIVVPTLNEATVLPTLLTAIAAQTHPPEELIVADAGSKDGTRDMALAAGAQVVVGGLPAVGRNAGARAASSELILFLDSDVAPGPDFLERFSDRFLQRGLDVATCLIEPLSGRLVDRVSADATNIYLQVVQALSPHAPGFCILVRRSLHEKIGGFDESVMLAEDHDYVQRAARQGRFGVVTTVRVPVSMRRLEKEGVSRLALKYLWCEMHALAGKPIRSLPFTYEFGSFGDAVPERRRLVDIARLREQLGHFGDPLQELSAATQERLDRLAKQDPVPRQALEKVELPDLERLYRYLRRRRIVLRLTGRQARLRLARHADAGLEWLLLADRRPASYDGDQTTEE